MIRSIYLLRRSLFIGTISKRSMLDGEGRQVYFPVKPTCKKISLAFLDPRQKKPTPISSRRPDQKIGLREKIRGSE